MKYSKENFLPPIIMKQFPTCGLLIKILSPFIIGEVETMFFCHNFVGAVHIIPINQLYYPLLTENIILYKGQVTTATARTRNIATKYENVFSVSYKAEILQDYHSTLRQLGLYLHKPIFTPK